MTKFKVGDRVMVKDPAVLNDIYKVGDTATYQGCDRFKMYDGEIQLGHDDTFELINEWKQGDILIDEDGDQRKILGVCGEVYILSEYNDFDRYDFTQTREELEKLGYKLKTAQDEFIEIVGKKYNKDAVIERLKELKPIQ